MANDNDIMESLIQQQKKIYMSQYQNKTDEELHAIVRHNAQACLNQDGVELAKTSAETKACYELIKIRQLAREIEKTNQALDQYKNRVIRDAVSEWKANIVSRRMRAVINIPNATSYFGQLVLAVLDEEDGLGAKEICQWSEELAALSEEEMNALLNALVKEGVIIVDKEQKYRLLTLCDETLLPVDAVQWARNKYKYEHNNDYLRDGQFAFLRALVARESPLTEDDWLEAALPARDLERVKKESHLKDRYMDKLNELVERGVLMKTPIGNTKFNLYYFPMLGEEMKK